MTRRMTATANFLSLRTIRSSRQVPVEDGRWSMAEVFGITAANSFTRKQRKRRNMEQ